MKAIIIAAGSGTRIQSTLKKIPKSLLDINGKTLLELQVSILRNNGINDIIVITGSNHEKFDLKNIRYIKDEDHDEHDILFSLMAAIDEIFGDVLILYSDIIFEEKIFQQILESQNDIGVVIDLDWKKSYADRSAHPTSEAENVLIYKQRIKKIKKNIQTANIEEKIGEFLGILKLSNKGSTIFVDRFNQLKNNHEGKFHDAPSIKKAYLTDMIQELIDSGNSVSPILINGKWCEIDTEQDLERAKRIF